MRVAVVGAGAAGCFAAVQMKRMRPDVEVVVYEGGTKALAKVAVTGGGRCNLTNSFAEVERLGTVYPRGERLMKRLLNVFGPRETWQWFEREGVKLMEQPDRRVFPQSGDAMEVVDTLLRLMRHLGVGLKLGHRVKSITETDGKFTLAFVSEGRQAVEADKVVVAIGGCPQVEKLDMLKTFGLDLVAPVPSLFSFCIRDKALVRLMGTTVENVDLAIRGSKFRSKGALLVTHWGLSGPAVLKLSSYAARFLAECQYEATLSVNWMGGDNEQTVNELMVRIGSENRLKLLRRVCLPGLNVRLWEYLLSRAGMNPEMRWGDLGRKGYNRLSALLTNDSYAIAGKNRFKDEFVTCGGVALSAVNPKTLACRTCQGLYFAGEVLDVDAVTGGFNLQAAWTTGYVVAKALAGE